MIKTDRAVLNRYLPTLHGFELPNRFIEVPEMYARKKRRNIPELSLDLTFENLAKDLDVPVIGRHTALGDVISTSLILIKLSQFEH
jgi:DNA polymerase-3 subunit epsilon